MLGLHALLADSVLRLRSLVAVAEDIADGVVVAPNDDQAVLRMVIGSLTTELRGQDMLVDRIRELAQEIAQEDARR